MSGKKPENDRYIDVIDLNQTPDRPSAGKKDGRPGTGQGDRSSSGRKERKRKRTSSGQGKGEAPQGGQTDRRRQRSSGRAGAKALHSNREFAVITYLFLVLFLALCVWFVYFTGFKSESFINSPYNPRLSKMAEHTVRGEILSADGKVLAKTETGENGQEKRVYPYGAEYAHAVGFSTNGMSGVELSENFELLRSHDFFLKQIGEELSDQKTKGDSVVTTLNSAAQDAAYSGMGSYRGAVVALDPATGKILCMVSKPDFDPGKVEAEWESLTSSEESVLLNRATQGLYPPGSTGKILTALEYLQEGGDPEVTYDCKGSFTRDGFTIHCFGGKAHGSENLRAAFADSCNTSFAQIGLTLDRNRETALANRLFFNTSLPTDLPNTAKSSFSLSDGDSDALVMQTSIGQGNTLVSPLHMALISEAVANGGLVMEPYIVDRIVSSDGTRERTIPGKAYGSVMSEDDAAKMKDLMGAVVSEGTGQKLLSDRYTAYGKTGTAEFSTDKNRTHSWFTGFAEADGKTMAIAVIMEDSGTSSAHAVPLAKSVFDAYFKSE